VVLKGIDPVVTAKKVFDALKEKGFSAKNVSNIINRKKEPQQLFRVELEPDSRVLKKNEVHPIYNLQYLLHRRINVEEPHKKERPSAMHKLSGVWTHQGILFTSNSLCSLWRLPQFG